jgi:hypothetical protein
VKVLVLILSVYLLGLCCYPCFEDDCADHDDAPTTEVHAEAGDESDQEEACTPFCFDNCCTTHIICQTSFLQVPSDFLFNEQPNHPYAVTMIGDVPFSIWQPPKIQALISILA